MRVYGRCPANALTKKMRATPRKSTPHFFCVRSPLDGRSTDATFFTQCPENRVNRRFQGAKEPLGASRKSQQQTIEDVLTALYDSIADRGPDVEGPGVLTERYNVRKSTRSRAWRGLFTADRRVGRRYKALLMACQRLRRLPFQIEKDSKAKGHFPQNKGTVSLCFIYAGLRAFLELVY